MAFSYGFYNSLNGDRKYDAEDMSRMFDGIITDGVLGSVGDTFAVKAGSGLQVTVGSGRAWFDHTWSYNDAAMQITLTSAEVLLDRYDAIVLEVNSAANTRTNAIKVITGTAASSPTKPTMESSQYLHQYPLAYIKRTAGSTSVSQSDIENAVGTSECPLCTGPLTTMEFDQIIAQWQNQFDTWFSNLETTLDSNTAANLLSKINTLTYKLPYMYSAALTTSSWTAIASSNAMYTKGYRYYANVTLTKDVSDAPTTTGSSTFVSGPSFKSTGNVDDDEKLSEALAIINAGQTSLLSNSGNVNWAGRVLIYVAEKPSTDITVRWAIMK